MDKAPLSPLAVWVLTVLVSEPLHAYAIGGGIASRSLMMLVPKVNSVRSALETLERRGLVVEVGREPGNGSAHERKLYAITDGGLKELEQERYRMVLATKAIDRALAQRFIDKT